MADLLVLNTSLDMFYGTSVLPDDTARPNTEESFQLQQQTKNDTHDKFLLAANASAQALPALPHTPYSGLILICDGAIKINVNGQGNQIIQAGGFVTMALVNSVTLTNDQVPAGGSVPVDVNVRYMAWKNSP